jgi:hypothetical protein
MATTTPLFAQLSDLFITRSVASGPLRHLSLSRSSNLMRSVGLAVTTRRNHSNTLLQGSVDLAVASYLNSSFGLRGQTEGDVFRRLLLFLAQHDRDTLVDEKPLVEYSNSHNILTDVLETLLTAHFSDYSNEDESSLANAIISALYHTEAGGTQRELGVDLATLLLADSFPVATASSLSNHGLTSSHQIARGILYVPFDDKSN